VPKQTVSSASDAQILRNAVVSVISGRSAIFGENVVCSLADARSTDARNGKTTDSSAAALTTTQEALVFPEVNYRTRSPQVTTPVRNWRWSALLTPDGLLDNLTRPVNNAPLF